MRGNIGAVAICLKKKNAFLLEQGPDYRPPSSDSDEDGAVRGSEAGFLSGPDEGSRPNNTSKSDSIWMIYVED